MKPARCDLHMEADLRAFISSRLAEQLGVDPASIDPHERFVGHGLDSRGATELVAVLAEALGRPLSPVLIWRYPTPDALARHLAGATEGEEHAHAPRPAAEDEPIAVVGMACRFPGASDPEAFWRLLRDGVNAITDAPEERWSASALFDPDPAAPGKMSTRWGGFLDDIDRFDPMFFGISPREAAAMDPQQRLMLELSWEAIEDAGIVPGRLKGSQTGVFLGAIWDDYAALLHLCGPQAITQHSVTGYHRSIIANRVSYVLGLHGPSMAIDSACSASLVSVHLACESLRRGESTMALAGGVNLNIIADSAIGMSKFGGMSPDGRCFTFDARANGYVRGEGGGVVVLKRLSQAVADGDSIHCIVRGSAVNNDGASNGLTAPNPVAQEAGLRLAYQRAGVDPADVQYVELHGTGTQLGDPIEAGALGAVLGKGRPSDRPLLVGSAKTNIGHLEGAAGIVGLLKVALCIRHRQLAPSLHFETPNPHIPFADLKLDVARTLRPWPNPERPLLAGVSSFGMGGTNCHVVLAEGSSRPSAHARVLRRRAEAAVRAPAKKGPVFVFAGQGAQWAGMGLRLLRHEPVFRRVIEACSGFIREILGWSLMDELSREAGSSRLDRIDVGLPAIAAIELAVAAQWRAWGVQPAAVVGHSLGEIMAAHVAGVLSLEETMQAVCVYGRSLARLRGKGAMGVVGLSWEQTGEVLSGYEGRLFRAIQYSVDSTVLAGETDALDALLRALGDQKIFCRRVAIDVTPHCPLADGLRDEVFGTLRHVRPAKGTIPVYSEVTGDVLAGNVLDAHHWTRNLCDPALFSTAVDALIRDGFDTFLEVSPHPLTLEAIASNLRRAGAHGITLPSLRRDEDEHEVMLDTLGALHVAGVPVNWAAIESTAAAETDRRGFVVPFLVSGKTQGALRDQAVRMRAHLAAHSAFRLVDVAASLATTRTHFEHRVALLARTPDELLDALGSLVDDLRGGDVELERARGVGKLAFLFTGQGSQRTGMGRELDEAYPVFRAALDAVCAGFAAHLEHPLREVLFTEAAAERLEQTEYAQPALFALEVALFRLLESWGLQPDFLLGHSIGEVVAAHVSGVLTLEDACTLVAARGRLMQALPGGGAMVAVQASEEEVRSQLAGRVGIAVAAVNGPQSTVISGDAGAVSEVAGQFAGKGRKTTELRVSHAFHSPHMDGMLESFRRVVEGLTFHPGRIAIVSNGSGRRATQEELSSVDHWVRHVRESVRFLEGVRTLEGEGVGTFVELGPHGVLTALAHGCLTEEGRERSALLPTLHAGRPEVASLLEALGGMHVRGHAIDWEAFFAPLAPERVALPTYAFQRERYWLDAAPTSRAHGRTPLEDLRYRVVWKPLAPVAGDAAGTWLLLVPRDLVGEPLATALGRALAESGAHVLSIPLSEPEIDRHVLAARVREALADRAAPRGVISLLAFDTTLQAALPRGFARTLALAQALGDARVEAPLWLLTQGGVSIGPSDRLEQPLHALTWGLGRVIALEHPGRWGGLVDVHEGIDAKGLERLVAVLGTAGGEDQLALRARGVFARRLVRARREPRTEGTWTPRGTVLVTGGTGGLGADLARWLARHGAEHVVAIGRRGADAPGAGALEAELAAAGARLTVLACDVSDRRALAALLERLEREGHAPRAVFHAAGVAEQTALAELSFDDVAAVAAGKVAGAQHLHELLAHHELDAFVLFSSIAGIWGSGQQGGYAAANAYLDALAEHRRGSGQPALSIAWGVWAGESMADAVGREQLRRRGVSAMARPLAFAALQDALDRGETNITVADIDWDRFVPSFAAARWRPFLDDLAEARRAHDAMADPPPREMSEARERTWTREALLAMVLAETAMVLGFPKTAALEPRTGFSDLGLDSLMAVELRRALERQTDLRLPATLAFDHPSPEHVARRLLELLVPPDRTPAAEEPTRRSALRTPAEDEALAIVGLGLRLPGGVTDLDSFWGHLERGDNPVRRVPRERWDAEARYDSDPQAKGKSYVREGAFLDRIDEFDASFFGIHPREARQIDPQHRLLLETAWEALEDAGIVPSALEDGATGVFVGIGASDYERLRAPADEAEAHTMMGTLPSFAAGRLAFTLGLQGPTLSIDTACSSSLVALHLAGQALRRGECDLALAAGVQVMASAEPFVLLSRTHALAADGLSKTFSARADGYGRGEGAVVVALERLQNALVRGRRILAVVRGSAVNHDGRSSGITAPNGTAQQKLLRAALEDARLAPGDVDVVECHGTGTSLGDPIEVQALAAVYGAGRGAERPLLLGAVKTNIGHLESAAGLAGVAKMIAALRHRRLPATLHSRPRNPHVDWDALPVHVVDALRPWPANPDGRPRRAGVSAFGLSGTNAHVILEEPPRLASHAPPALPPLECWPLVLSGKTQASLDAQTERLHAHLLAHPDVALRDVAYSLATTRTHFEKRALVMGRHGRGASHVLAGDAKPGRKLAVLFTGQGSQRPEMGRALYETFPPFREALDAVCAHFDGLLDRSLRTILLASEGTADAASLKQTAFAQPALFALEVALFRLLEGWGLAPDLLLGHSIGELVAAHVAGVLSLPDACTLVAARAQLMQAVAIEGAMVSLPISEEEARALLRGREETLSVAARNGPLATVVSGDRDAVLEIARHVEASGRKATRLDVSHAFHSPHMEGMLEDFGRVARTLTFGPPRIPIVSNATGRRFDAGPISAEHWVRHVRDTVRFADGIRTLEAEGVTTFLELGPHGVLSALARDNLSDAALRRSVFVSALRKDQPALETLITALGTLHAEGHAVDWEAFFAPFGSQRVQLPTYAFQRERHWLDSPRALGLDGNSATSGRYPLSGRRLDLPDGSVLHTLEMGPAIQRYLEHHRVYGRIVVPGAFHLAVLLAIAEAHWPLQALQLSDVQFLRVLSFEHAWERTTLHVQLTPQPSGFAATLFTRDRETSTVHARAVLGPAPEPVVPHAPPTTFASKELGSAADALAHVDAVLRAMDVTWGPRWWWLRQAHSPSARAGFGRFEAPEDVPTGDAPLPGGLLDNAFSLELWGAPAGAPEGEVPRLPFAIDRLVWYGRGAVPCFAENVLRDRPVDGDSRVSDLAFWDAAGMPIAHIEGFTNRRAPKALFLPEPETRALYVVQWEPFHLESTHGRGGTWAWVGGDPVGMGEVLSGLGVRLDAYPDLEAFRTALDAGASLPDAVVFAAGSRNETTDVAHAVRDAAQRGLAVLHAWLADERVASIPLVLLTGRAVSTRASEPVLDLPNAPLWGLWRTAQSELLDRRIVLVDTDLDPASLRALPGALTSDEPQLALRQGVASIPRIGMAPASPAVAPSLDPEGTVLVTGATGALGAIVARHLVARHGVRHLLLVSRRGHSAPGAAALVDALEAAGAQVTLVAGDVSDRATVQQLLDALPAAHPLVGVVHTAGVLDDGLLTSLTAPRMAHVFGPKADAAIHLHELTRDRRLAMFVLFSSLSGVLGNPGQANYAAANAALDALASYRRSLGLPALSLLWGPWDGVGMAAALSDSARTHLRRQNVPSLTADEALALFDAALGRAEACVVAAHFDLAGLKTHVGAVPLLLRRLAPRPARSAAGAEKLLLKQRIDTLPERERDRAFLDFVRAEIAATLGLSSARAVEPARPVHELGLDSLMMMDLRNRLMAATGLRLPPTLLFDHPTPLALADYVRSEVLPGDAPAAAETPSLEVAVENRFESATDAELFELFEREFRKPLANDE